MLFNINGIVNSVGVNAINKELYVVVPSFDLNDRGDEEDKERTEYSINGVVQIVSSEDSEVTEGILRPRDLICFFDENESNVEYLVNFNELKYESNYYKIVQVISEIGHVEVLAKRI